MKRVVVTGMGTVNPLGNTVAECFENVKNGVLGIDYIKRFDTTDFKVKIAGEVKDFNPEDYIEKKEVKRLDLYSIYALAAAKEAVTDSCIKDNVDPFRFGVIVGSGIGGLITLQEQIIKMHEKGPARVSPLFIPMAISNMGAGHIAIAHGAKGINTCVVTACATGTNCIGEGYRNIKYGYLDACIVGGSEASVTEVGIAGFTTIQALTTCEDIKRASIPFDKDRSGFVMGEGAGILVLEELNHALNRGAKIYGEVVGYGATCDAYHMTAPDPEGESAKMAMLNAIYEAGITPQDIDYINAHGTSTPHNDSSETLSIKKAFGDYAYKVMISSTKSMMGHLLGAAGAVEGIIAIKALEEGFVPPTIGLENNDPVCDLDYIKGTGRKANLKYSMSNSLGFGGHNASICFKKWEGK